MSSRQINTENRSHELPLLDEGIVFGLSPEGKFVQAFFACGVTIDGVDYEPTITESGSQTSPVYQVEYGCQAVETRRIIGTVASRCVRVVSNDGYAYEVAKNIFASLEHVNQIPPSIEEHVSDQAKTITNDGNLRINTALGQAVLLGDGSTSLGIWGYRNRYDAPTNSYYFPRVEDFIRVGQGCILRSTSPDIFTKTEIEITDDGDETIRDLARVLSTLREQEKTPQIVMQYIDRETGETDTFSTSTSIVAR